MNKKIVISSAIALIIIFAGFYFYNKPKTNNEQITPVVNTQRESEKETLGQITFIDNSHLKLKEVIRDTNCFDSMDIDVDNDPEIKEKSLQNMQGTITQEEWNKFFVEKVNKKYNNNLPWCPKGALYNETGKEISFNLTPETNFIAVSFDDPNAVREKSISKESFIDGYNKFNNFHSRIEITSVGSNAIKVRELYLD